MNRRRPVATWILLLLLLIVLIVLAVLVLGGPFDARAMGILGASVVALIKVVVR